MWDYRALSYYRVHRLTVECLALELCGVQIRPAGYCSLTCQVKAECGPSESDGGSAGILLDTRGKMASGKVLLDLFCFSLGNAGPCRKSSDMILSKTFR